MKAQGDASAAPISKLRKSLFALLCVVFLPTIAFVAVEGFSSLILFGRSAILATRPLFSEEVSTEYDPELGWAAKKSFAAPNFYGPGVGLHTNERGFRGTSPTADSVPPGKRRVLCSGDSFTLGWGVGDHASWCALLGTSDTETVNMGQGGYGIDQAYLWYLRDGLVLEHDAHILAFVTHDFARMAMDYFIGFAKPRLAIDGDSLRTIGVPLPRRDRARTTRRLARSVQSLRSAQLLGGLTSAETRDLALQRPDTSQTRAVFTRIVAHLKRINRDKESQLVLVYLPDRTDYHAEGAHGWRTQVQHIADSLGVPFIDLIPEIRQKSGPEVTAMYFHEQDEKSFAGAAGHFNEAGNRWASRIIRERLDSLRFEPVDAPRRRPLRLKS